MIEKKVLVFGGTLEGRQITDYLCEHQITHTICVATDYGEEVLQEREFRTIHQGRLDVQQMIRFMLEGQFAFVVDATHPYAAIVSQNIRAAANEAGLTYLRYLRARTGWEGDTSGRILVNSAKEAAEYLEQQTGTIFLTTGSKELHIFTETITDKSRLFARVLPSAQVVASCRELGLEGRQIFAMQGPFSALINEAMLLQTGAKFLVSKDTGTTGGFPDKMEAAQKTGVQCVIIRRPEEAGEDFETVTEKIQQLLTEKFSFIAAEKNADVSDCEISCIGIGMGTLETLTHESAETIRTADILFGAKRILDSIVEMLHLKELPEEKRPVFVEEYIGTKISDYLDEHPQYKKAAILMSGDVGFYSGARGIEKAFSGKKVQYCCGISSVVYFASKIPTTWQDAKLVSAHGKDLNILNHVNRYPKLILLVSGREDVERICAELVAAQQTHVRVTVGTNLSYPNETVRTGAPVDFLICDTIGLHIMMIENPQADHVITPGISDEEFIRGKVPMTKEEIRILSVAKLQLRDDSIVYDVGAGTGSVSIEIARLCTNGKVYAIERKAEGIELIQANANKMCLSNVITVEGLAPEAMKDLPAPTHAFIGGSSGNMKQIIECLRAKNPQVRIVINTIALESITEVMNLLKEFDAEDADIVQVSAAKSKVLGRYHMMTGLNPVYIISF